MTTSKSPGPLSAVPFLPVGGETEQELASLERYRQAQKTLVDSYEKRNQLFDPVLLAMAQGFLAPTKSGSFGESISNVAGMVGPAAAEEEKRARESAAMRAQLAATEAMQYGEMRKQRMGANLLSLDQPLSEEEFRRYAMIAGPKVAAEVRAIRDKMSATQREEAFRKIIPDLLKLSSDGKTPTLDSMLAIAAAKNVDPKLVVDLYDKVMPKPVAVGEGSTLVQPGLGGGSTTALFKGPQKDLEIVRKAQLLNDSTTDPTVRLALAIDLLGPGVDPKRILTANGEVSTDTIRQLNQRYPGFFGGATPSTTPARPATGAPGATVPQATPQAAPQATPQAAPQAATRPQAAPRTEEAAKTFGPGNYAIPQPSRNLEAPTGFARGSKEDLEARQQQTTFDAQRFNKVFEDASAKGDAAVRVIPTLETALRAVQSADYRGGIFARPEQFVNQVKSALGIADSVDVSRMLKTAVVDQALREQVLQSLRASFGGNPTEGERAFLMSVNSISDPRELLTYALMGKMAAAQKDATKFDYLRTYGNYGTAAASAFDRWSGNKGPDFYYPPLAQAREKLLSPSTRPKPTATDIEYGKQPAYREAFKNKFGKYPEDFGR